MIINKTAFIKFSPFFITNKKTYHFIQNDINPFLFPYYTKRVIPPIKVVPRIPPTTVGTTPRVDLNNMPEIPPVIIFF